MYVTPKPSLSSYLRIGGKIGAFAGVGIAFLYAVFVGAILLFMADLVVFPVGEIIDAIALAVCMGLGYMAGMIVAFLVWLIALAVSR